MKKSPSFFSPGKKVPILLPQSPTKSVADMKQLSEGQRYKIEAYLQAGIKKDEIARLAGIHRSTLYRELRRNKWKPTRQITPPPCALINSPEVSNQSFPG